MLSHVVFFSNSAAPIAETPLKLFLASLPRCEELSLVMALVYNKNWQAFIFDLAKLANFPTINPQVLIKELCSQHKKPSERAKAFLRFLVTEYPTFTAENLQRLFFNRKMTTAAHDIKKRLATKPSEQQSLVLKDHPKLLKRLFERSFSAVEREELLVELATSDHRIHASLAMELEGYFERPEFRQLPYLDLINADHKTPLERIRAYLCILMNDAPDLVLRKESQPYYVDSDSLKNAPIPPDNGVKALLGRLSSQEKHLLLHALCPTLWKDLAKALEKKVQCPKLIQAKIRLIDCNSRDVLKKAQTLLDSVDEWPELTPEQFVEALEEILPFKVSQVVAKKLTPNVSSGVPPVEADLQNESMKCFLYQYDFDEMNQLVLALCGESRWVELGRYLMFKTNQRQLNLITIDLIRYGAGFVEPNGQFGWSDQLCVKKLFKLIDTCPEITPQVWVQGLKAVGIRPDVVKTAEDNLTKLSVEGRKPVPCRP